MCFSDFTFRIGSLVIDHDVFVQNSPSALVDVVNLMKNISDGKTNMTYNGNDASALSVSYTDSSNNQGTNVNQSNTCIISCKYEIKLKKENQIIKFIWFPFITG